MAASAARARSAIGVDTEDTARIRSPPGLMADEPAAEQPEGGASETAVSQPHDKYFYRVFSNEQDAASLLRTCVPAPLADTLKWSTLTHQSGRFVADDWRGKEADLLFSVQREGTETPVLVYVLLEHQSTPDPWLRLRLLGYCVQVWQEWRRKHRNEERLPLLVPLVFYQGARRWEYTREFADLVTEAAPEWRWVPRFEHLLIDQTQRGPGSVPGGLVARLAQIALMAAFRKAREELFEWAARLMGELYRVLGDRAFEEVIKHVEYLLATQPDKHLATFAEALRRNVPGRGGDVMNYMQQLIERGRREGLQEGLQEGIQEGKLEGQIRTIEGFLERDFSWSTIAAATGIDEAAFGQLKRQLQATRDGADR
jgi:predicted transposase YdaD